MALTKNFLHSKPEFFQISRFRLIVGMSIGLLYAFGFYSFLYLVREAFRILSVTEVYDLWILTDKEVYFYNLFFAFVAVILGQSIALTFWLDQPKHPFVKQNYRKTSIVHDQRVLNWYFLSWFSKVALVFGLFFGLAFRGSFYVFSFYPDYNYLFILIIIVLFFQTWNTIQLIFKRKSLLWLSIAMIVITAISFGFSRINLIDYKSINENYLSKNIYHKYELELTESNVYDRVQRGSYYEKIYIVESRDGQSKTMPIILIDNQKIEFKDLHEKLAVWASNIDEYSYWRIKCQLYVHKTVKMEFVNRIKGELSRYGLSSIGYVVIPTNRQYDSRYYINYTIQENIPDLHSDWFDPMSYYNHAYKSANIIEIKQDDSGTCYINGVFTENNQIKQTIKESISKNWDYHIIFHVNDQVNFSDYLDVISYSKEALYELQNEYAKEVYAKPINSLDYEEQGKIKEKYPFYFFKLTTELKKMIEKN